MPIDTSQPFPLQEVDTDCCRFCGTSLLSEEIPEASRHLFGTATHFRREMGVETDAYDGTLYYVCPDCHHAWPRLEGGTGRLEDAAAKAVAVHEKARALLSDHAAVEVALVGHADAVAFALGMAGFRWTGWAIDPRTGAWMLLLGTYVNEHSPEQWAKTKQAESLVGDITGFPVYMRGTGVQQRWEQGDEFEIRPAPLPFTDV